MCRHHAAQARGRIEVSAKFRGSFHHKIFVSYYFPNSALSFFICALLLRHSYSPPEMGILVRKVNPWRATIKLPVGYNTYFWVCWE